MGLGFTEFHTMQIKRRFTKSSKSSFLDHFSGNFGSIIHLSQLKLFNQSFFNSQKWQYISKQISKLSPYSSPSCKQNRSRMFARATSLHTTYLTMFLCSPLVDVSVKLKVFVWLVKQSMAAALICFLFAFRGTSDAAPRARRTVAELWMT